MRARLIAIALAAWLAAGVAASAQSRHADPALEALLPANLGGKALLRESQSGSDLTRQSAAFGVFLKELGKGPEDFVVASAYAPSGLRAEIGAWRVRGVAGRDLLAGWRRAVRASSNIGLDEAEETLSGRVVLRLGGEGQLARGPLYAAAGSDTLFFVQTSERTLAEEAFGKLRP